MAQDRPLDLAALRVEIDRQGARWRSVDTTIALLEEEDRRRRLGVPLPAEHEVEQIQSRAKALAKMPIGIGADGGGGVADGIGASFDARRVGGNSYVTPIKNQGGCGSCVAFGTIATVETTAAFQRGQPGLKVDLSEQQLFFVEGASTGASCSNGWWPEHAFTCMRDTGVTFEDYMPYNAGGGGTLNPDWPNRLARLTGFQTLTGNVAAMKQHIQTHGAISACFLVYQDFFSYGGGVYHHLTGELAGGHCISIIGFDDAQGCWICKNQWGTGWGDQGFFKIAYGECAMETWRVHGADYVNLRMWIDALVRGMWSNESADNAWAYMDNLGWSRLAHGAAGANTAMLTELTSSRLRNQPVHAFIDMGQVTQTYVF
jgi:C1A family cysteine protease